MGVVVLYSAITALEVKGLGFGGNIIVLSSSIVSILTGMLLV
jgi:hypothetical protein